MNNPTAKELMQIVASVGLSNNFAAIRSLITEGIQKGHMKLHLNNILNFFNADEEEKAKAGNFFRDKQISFKTVSEYLETNRNTV